MRFINLAARYRLQKARQTSRFKNLLLYLRDRQSQVFKISGVCFALYCLNKYYFRKYKGLNKISQRFSSKNDSSPAIIKDEINYFDIFLKNHIYPWAIIFPKTIEETQKLIKLAKKYGISIKNKNIEHLDAMPDDSSSPYIVINQKNMRNFSFDPEMQTITIGVGLTIKEINEKLIEKGYYLPIHHNQKNLRIFELINRDNADIVHNNYHSIADFIHSLNIVLPNAEALMTNVPTKKIGYGVSLNELFIGSNATLGIPIEATLKVIALPKKVHKINFCANLKNISNIFFDVFNDIQKLIQKNGENIKNCVLKIDNEKVYLEMLGFSKIDYGSFNDKYYKKFEINEKTIKLEKNSKKEIMKDITKNYLEKNEEIFKYQYDKADLINLIINTKDQYLTELMKINKKSQYYFSFNIVKNLYALHLINPYDVSYLKDEPFERFNKNIMNYIVDRNGLLINYYDIKKMKEFKANSKLVEFGKNNLHMQKTLKKMLDPQNLFLNEEFNHEILE